MAVGRESVLLVRADWSYFVYLGVFDNPIIVMGVEARPLARSMERGVGRVSVLRFELLRFFLTPETCFFISREVV